MNRNIKTRFGLLTTVVAFAAFAAAHASASSAPISISYAKTCNEVTGHCLGTAGNGGTLEMQVTSYRATGEDAQLTLIEWIKVGNVSFTAEMNGHASPAGFIVLNGTVTDGAYAGAQVHQRSNLVGEVGNTTSWTGSLQLAPASA
jgi:hypothetical protein